MLTIEKIQDNPYYQLHEVTPEIVALLKENPGTGIYVDTGRTVKRIVGRYYPRPNGEREFARFEQQSVRGMSTEFMPLSNKLAEVFDPESYAERMRRKAEERERIKVEQSGHAPIPVGTIFTGSYGYDATISKFWQVVRSSAKSVWVRQIRQRTLSGGSGPCCWMTEGVKDSFVKDGSEHRCTVRWSRDSPSIKVGSIYAWPWDGNPIENDDYH